MGEDGESPLADYTVSSRKDENGFNPFDCVGWQHRIGSIKIIYRPGGSLGRFHWF